MTNDQTPILTCIRRTFYSIWINPCPPPLGYNVNHSREILEVDCKFLLQELHILKNILVGEFALREMTSKGQ